MYCTFIETWSVFMLKLMELKNVFYIHFDVYFGFWKLFTYNLWYLFGNIENFFGILLEELLKFLGWDWIYNVLVCTLVEKFIANLNYLCGIYLRTYCNE